MKICPICKRNIYFSIGEIWVHDDGWEVKILDYGNENIWLLHLENQKKIAWDLKEFLEDFAKK